MWKVVEIMERGRSVGEYAISSLFNNDIELGILDMNSFRYEIVDGRRLAELSLNGQVVNGVKTYGKGSVLDDIIVYRAPYKRVGGDVVRGGVFVVDRIKDGTEVLGYRVLGEGKKVVYMAKEMAISYFKEHGVSNGFVRAGSVGSYYKKTKGIWGFEDTDVSKIVSTSNSKHPMFDILSSCGCKVAKGTGKVVIQVPKKGVNVDLLEIPVDKELLNIEIKGGELNVKKLIVRSGSVSLSVLSSGRVLGIELIGENGTHRDSEIQLASLVNEVTVSSDVVRVINSNISAKIAMVKINKNVRDIVHSFNFADIKAVDLREVVRGEISYSFNSEGGDFETHVMLGGSYSYNWAFSREKGVLIRNKFSADVERIRGFWGISNKELDLSRLGKLKILKEAFSDGSNLELLTLPECDTEIEIDASFRGCSKLKKLYTPSNKNKRINAIGGSFNCVDEVIGLGAIVSIEVDCSRDVSVVVKGDRGVGTLVNILWVYYVARVNVDVKVEKDIKKLRYHKLLNLDDGEGTNLEVRMNARVFNVGEELEEFIPLDGEDSRMYGIQGNELYNTKIKVLPHSIFRGNTIRSNKLLLPKGLEKVERHSANGFRLDEVYVPASVKEIETFGITADKVLIHRNSEADKILKGKIGKIYVDSIEEVIGSKRLALDENTKGMYRAAGIYDSDIARELGIGSNTDAQHADEILKAYKKASEKLEVREIDVDLDTRKFQSIPLNNLESDVMREYLGNILGKKSNKFLENSTGNTSSFFNLLSNLITGNTDGSRAMEILDKKHWDDISSFDKVVESIFSEEEVVRDGLWYLDDVSAVVAIPIVKATFSNKLNDMVLLIIVNGEIKFTTLIRANKFWMLFFQLGKNGGRVKGVSVLADKGDSWYRGVSNIKGSVGAVTLGKVLSDGKAKMQHIVPVGNDVAMCLVTGRLLHVESGKRGEMFISRVSSYGEYNIYGKISDSITENKRALECIEFLNTPGKASYRPERDCYEVELYKKGYTADEMINKALSELPIVKDRVNSDWVNRGLGRLFCGKYRETLCVANNAIAAFGEGRSTYVLEEDLKKGTKTIKVISIPVKLETVLGYSGDIESLRYLYNSNNDYSVLGNTVAYGNGDRLQYGYKRGVISVVFSRWMSGKREYVEFSGVDLHGIRKALMEEEWGIDCGDKNREGISKLYYVESMAVRDVVGIIMKLEVEKEVTPENLYLVRSRYSKAFEYLIK